VKYLIFRNHTVEHLFTNLDADYCGYGDLLHPTEEADTLIWFNMLQPQSDSSKLAQEIESYGQQLQWLIDKNPQKSIIVFLLSRKFVLNWVQTDRSVLNEITKFNAAVIKASNSNNLIKYIDIEEYLNCFAVKQVYDWKYFLISKMIVSPVHTQTFKKWFGRKLIALENKRKKCLVVDLDNTLWGGIIGEDGVFGIALGDTYPGLAFRTFQEYLIEASKKGVILAICSKNNLMDVEEVWEKHPSMLLRKEHFSSVRINWSNKGKNIQEIAQELNIGLDSLVFIDDNPAERELVKQMLPDVIVPDFPANPYELPAFILAVWEDYFQVYSLTDEDINKTEQYRQNAKRLNDKIKFISEEDYLKSLDMQLTFIRVNEYNITRIAQMTQKTNQFNLTTRRYKVDDIKMLVDQGHDVFCLDVKDKFGDNGITAAAIVKYHDNCAEIDSFLLSCRIIGRGIEKQFLLQILNKISDKGCIMVSSSYIPTKKNKQTERFFDTMGFNFERKSDNGERTYSFTIYKKCKQLDYFSIIDESDRDE